MIKFLRQSADAVAASLLAAIFVLFLLQVFTRYVIRQPLGWTLEACLLAWLWLVFWSAAFTLQGARTCALCDLERPRFAWPSQDIRHHRSDRHDYRVRHLVLPTLDFVTFMAIESTSLLKFRFDFVFAIYLVFAAAIIWRSAVVLWQARRKP